MRIPGPIQAAKDDLPQGAGVNAGIGLTNQREAEGSRTAQQAVDAESFELIDKMRAAGLPL